MGNNIAVPYSSYINGGVKEGMELVISGTVKPNADRFSVNLCSTSTVDQGDCAFHFNPRFNQGTGCVVRNHKHKGNWGPEETAGGMPLRKGQPFIMRVKVQKQGYKVFVNSHHFCDFTNRLPFATIQFLHIAGDVYINDIHLKPSTPHTTPIPGGLSDGLDVAIRATPKSNGNMFSVNFITGHTYESGEVAFHFNPRTNQGCVVRNSRLGGKWVRKETAGGMPFAKDCQFNMNIMVNNYGFKIFVNNSHFCDYTHRMAKEAVQNLHIRGEVEIDSVQFNRQNVHAPYPGSKPAGEPVFYPPAPVSYPHAGGPMHSPNVGGPMYNPVVPVLTPIQGGFYPGKIIHITGVPHIGGSRFHVNLVCGFSQFSDLALHFDVRFNYGSDRNLVVRTHRHGGQYGMEEKHQPYFPFAQNANFEMILLCEPHCIKVAVNNQHFIEFNHRVQPLSLVDHLQIIGDVSIHQIRFQ